MTSQTPKKIKKKGWLILAIVVVLLIIVIVVWQTGIAKKTTAAKQQKNADTTAQKAALTVTVVSPQQQNWKQTFTANGNIAAWQEVVIGSELSGQRLTRVNVNVGDEVRRGQVLAEINSETIRADLAAAKASYAEAQAVLTDAITNNKRIQQLKNTGAISAQEATQYQTSQATAQAKLDAARAQIESNQLRLAQTRVVSPDNGVISARTATVGSLAQTGQELFRLIRDHRLEWRAEVTTSDLYKLKQGMTAHIISPDPAQPAVTGKVRMIAPVIDPQTRYGLVYVDIPTTQAVRMGMFVKGEFDLGQKPALTVPQTALLLRDGFSYVFTVNDKNRVTQQKVNVGRRLGDRVEILDLAPNVKVVSSGTGFLADGDLVSIAKDIPDTPLTKQLVTTQEK
ncbi:putative Co/Zn/Cd efflux system membrane fusion protein [Acinetobacter sp. neg1]|uniref:efflux RND transporter periplasmic adaptor subunit n=1 Tax=Acinetobacter TaxID=469 RepID=UPI0005421F47|nr:MULTISPECIES: efflux RND transporter periplasmic adaptor subunit [Acinetobacter]KHF76043.1 putative Co/Zn/Cd efflux system membrane fusion protein [Acinetobacter sp. neg1]MBJ8481655.1 efflux RND transporter periplasmic adaptor subunit [Acinetobacter vivianii]